MSTGISKRMKRARELLRSGKATSKAEAARMTGLGRSAISKDPVCRDLMAGKSGKRDPMARALDLMAEGKTRLEAAFLANVHPNSITNAIARAKRLQRKKEATEPAGCQAHNEGTA